MLYKNQASAHCNPTRHVRVALQRHTYASVAEIIELRSEVVLMGIVGDVCKQYPKQMV